MKAKNFILSISVAVALLGCFILGFCVSSHNAKEIEAEIVSVNECAMLIDVNGETWVWEFETGSEVEVGQRAVIQYSTNGTINIYDDEIIEVKLIN